MEKKKKPKNLDKKSVQKGCVLELQGVLGANGCIYVLFMLIFHFLFAEFAAQQTCGSLDGWRVVPHHFALVHLNRKSISVKYTRGVWHRFANIPHTTTTHIQVIILDMHACMSVRAFVWQHRQWSPCRMSINN